MAMVKLTGEIPPHSPPRTDEQRFERLLEDVINSAYRHTVKIKDSVFLNGLVRMCEVVLIFLALLFIDSSPALAWWSCMAVMALLVLDLTFEPSRVALRHAVRAGKLTEVAFYMRETALPVDEYDVIYFEEKARNAGADEFDFSLTNIAKQSRN